MTQSKNRQLSFELIPTQDKRNVSLLKHYLVVYSAVLCLVVSQIGCCVGPNYRAPAAKNLQSMYADASEPEASPPEALHSWWRSFNDPVLEELVLDVKLENLDLQAMAMRIAAARAQLQTTRAGFLPDGDATADYAYRDIAENASQFIASSAGNRGFSFHSLGFDTAWEIDLFGKIARTVEAAESNYRGTVEECRDLRVSLIAEVVATYIRLRLAQEQLQIASQNLASQEQTLTIVRDRQDSGIGSALDVAQAETNTHLTSATLPNLKQQELLASNQLALLTGRTPDANFRNMLAAGVLPEFAGDLSVGVPAQLLHQRPDLRQAQQEIAGATAKVGIATADKYPQVSILGTISVDAQDIEMLFTKGSLAYWAGPGFRWNIFNLGRLKHIIEGRNAELRVAVLEFQQTALRAVQEVESGLVVYHQQNSRSQDLNAAVESSLDALAVAEKRYNQGLIGFQPLLDSQRAQLVAADSLVRSKADALLGLVQVYKALGGGWSNNCN